MDARLLLSPILFVIAFVLARRDIRLALFLFIVAVPLDNRVIFTLGIERLLPVRVVLLAILVVSRKRIIAELKCLKQDKMGVVLVSLWLVRALSLLFTQNIVGSLGLLGFYSAILGLYFVLKSVFADYGLGLILRLLYLYLVVGVLTGVFSVIQFVLFQFFGTTLPAVWPTEHQPVRIGSTFWDVNHYAAYLLTVLPLLAVLAVRADRLKDQVLRGGVFLFSFLVLGMTFSRSAWLAFASSALLISGLLLSGRYFKEAKLFLTALGLLLVLILAGDYFLGSPVSKRLGTFFDVYNNDAIQAHALVLRGGWEIFQKFPILGGGYGGFNEHFRQTSIAPLYLEKDPVSWAHLPAHSIWMEVLSETGLLGFSLYSALMFLVLRTVYLGIRMGADRHLRVLTIAVFSSLFGLLLSGIFYSYNLEFFWFFIFLACFLAVYSRSDVSIS